jgi:hypothetical protein
MSASHSGSGVCNLINVHCFSSNFANFLIKLVKLQAPQLKANAKIRSVKQRIANRQCFMEPINVVNEDDCILNPPSELYV